MNRKIGLFLFGVSLPVAIWASEREFCPVSSTPGLPAWILLGVGLALLGSFGFWYWAVRQNKEQHQEYTIKVLRHWQSKEIRAARERVEEVDFTGLDPEDIYNLVNSNTELNIATHMLLWELDCICVALDVGIVDNEQVLRTTERPIKDIWTKFKPYILFVRELGEPEIYENLEKQFS